MAWKIPFINSTVQPSILRDSEIGNVGSMIARSFSEVVDEYHPLEWLMGIRDVGDEFTLFTTQERKVTLKVSSIITEMLFSETYYSLRCTINIYDLATNELLYTSNETQVLPNRVPNPTGRIAIKECFAVHFDDERKLFCISIIGVSIDTYRDITISGSYSTTFPAYPGWDEVYVAMGNISEVNDDPYQPGFYTQKQGGNGDFDRHSDPIQIPALPSISASDVGLITMYSPTSAQLEAFSNYLWSTDFNLDQFKKLFADPMEAIISLSIMPITPAGSLEYAKLGLIATPVQMTKMSTQYYEVDCGEMDITEFYGSALDYSPMTKFQIYLPYCGIHQLSADDITKKKLRVTYHIDALTGDCVCFLKVGDSVLYTFTGNVATQVPVSSTNASTIFLSTAMRTAPSMASGINGSSMSSMSGTFGQGVMDVMTTKPSVNRSGGISGAIGLMSIQRPYLIKEIPRQNMASDAYKVMGYPSNISGKLSEFKGYTVVDDIHIEGINATKQEIDEIYSILRGGYINAVTALQ